MEKEFIQHGTTSVYAHSVAVACFSLYLCKKLHLKVRERELIRGACCMIIFSMTGMIRIRLTAFMASTMRILLCAMRSGI